MAVKKTATTAKATPVKAKQVSAKQVSAKKPAAKKTTAKKTTAKGKSYVCGVCGLAVTIDTDCNCIETCDIICCGEAMKEKKTRTRAKAA